MDELLQLLRSARLRASAGEMGEAEGRIDEALELLSESLAHRPGPKLSTRAISDYLYEARFAVAKGDSFHAVAALNGALRVLEPKSKPEA